MRMNVVIAQTSISMMRLMTSEPATIMIAAMMSAAMPTGVCATAASVVRVETVDREEEADGSSETIQRAIRPCAVSVAIRRRSSSRRGRSRHLVEHVGGVRAGLALELRDERDLDDVAVLHPKSRRCGAPRRSGRRAARPRSTRWNSLLRRLARILDADRERADEAVAGAEAGREHVEVVRQLVGERLAPFAQAPADHEVRERRADRGRSRARRCGEPIDERDDDADERARDRRSRAGSAVRGGMVIAGELDVAPRSASNQPSFERRAPPPRARQLRPRASAPAPPPAA